MGRVYLKCTRKYSKEMEAWYLDFEIEDWKKLDGSVQSDGFCSFSIFSPTDVPFPLHRIVGYRERKRGN